MSYREIAQRLGYRGPSGAWKSVSSALDKTLRRERPEDVRLMELERLDAMLDGCWDKAVKGNTVSITAALRIAERRARLLGLDAPSQIEIGRLLESPQAAQLRAALWDALAAWPEARDKVDAVLGGLANE